MGHDDADERPHRDRAGTAREKAAAARSAQRRGDQRRRAVVILTSIVALMVVVVVVAVVALNHQSKSTPLSDNRASAPDSVVAPLRVPATTLSDVGQGTIVSAPQPVTGSALTSDGKPELLYIGAEFCPYCAAERWSMAVALSRFGTLHDVKLTKSSSTDVDPDTATLDFLDATYTSRYLSFVPRENEDRDRNKLQALTPAQTAIWNTYTGNHPSYPFLDFGNRYIVSGPSYDPAVLKGLTQQQIASSLADPTSPVAKAIDGGANVLTAAICGMTGEQPSSVCAASVIKSLKAKVDAQAGG
jgi:Domain of unknown function (DUF929)